MSRCCADEHIRIRVAAHDAVQHDHVGGRDLAFAGNEVTVEPLDLLSKPLSATSAAASSS